MRAILAMISSISVLPITFFCLALGAMRCAAPASSITSIALSGRVPVVDVARRELGRGGEGVGGVLDAVVRLEAALQAFQDLDRLVHRGSTTSIFWKRRDRAWSFSNTPRYSL